MTSTIAPHTTTAPRPTLAARGPSASPRISLHRQAPEAFRRHLLRGVVRVTVLVTADLATFWLLRDVVRAIRDRGVLGAGLADWLGMMVPKATLGGWDFPVALLMGLVVAGTYERGDARHDAGRILNGVALATALTLWHTIWSLGPEWFLVRFACTVASVWVMLAFQRQVIDRVVTRVRPQRERVLFVGDPDDPAAMRMYDRLVGSAGMTPLGWVSLNDQRVTEGVLGQAAEIWQVLQRTVPDTVVLCGSLGDEVFTTAVEASTTAGCRVLAVSRYYRMGDLRPGLIVHRGLPFVELTFPSLKARQLLIKRTIDLLAASVGLVVLAPVFALVAVAIKLDSPGPVIFRQRRVGRSGRTFEICKFRSMVVGAEGGQAALREASIYPDERLFKVPEDPRITRLGRWLRRCSMDELPQLINVLKGEMSLVGPRPPLPAEVAFYEERHFCRFDVKPGITGPWQVGGRNRVTDFEEVVRLEQEYIRKWSVWLDFRILARTVPVVLGMDGAH